MICEQKLLRNLPFAVNDAILDALMLLQPHQYKVFSSDGLFASKLLPDGPRKQCTLGEKLVEC